MASFWFQAWHHGRNLPYLPSLKINLVIYIILNLAGVLYATLVDVASPLPESCKYYAARKHSVPHLCVLLRVIKGIKHT